MATQLTEFHYNLSQGGKAGLFNFEDSSFDVKNIYNYYLRKVSTPYIFDMLWNFKNLGI